LLGKDAPGLSATTIARPKDVWIDEHKRWSERDLLAKSYVYVWADGVLVIIGAMPEGKKELLGLVADHHQKSSIARMPAGHRTMALNQKNALLGARMPCWCTLSEMHQQALGAEPQRKPPGGPGI